jgi:hypothetical protein
MLTESLRLITVPFNHDGGEGNRDITFTNHSPHVSFKAYNTDMTLKYADWCLFGHFYGPS